METIFVTNRLQQQGAANDITLAVEFLMGSARDLIGGKDINHPEVQEQLDFALRKLIPLDNSSRYGAQMVIQKSE